jgi:DNA polymerase III alpha subunit (gram-positive type)
MKYLFFDTETTGLPLNWSAPVEDLNNWPRMVQIAWIITDEKGNEIEKKSYIIKPDGYEIPEEASNIHRITTERAEKEGVDIYSVLRRLEMALDDNVLVAHNISFDEKIVGSEFLRAKMNNLLEGHEKICTMKSSTRYCALEKGKWPKLQELHKKLFGEEFEEAHDALSDIQATAKCFFELKRLNII